MLIPKDDLQIQLFHWPNNDELDTLDPRDVFVQFYDHYHFDDIHMLLWDMFKFLIEHDALNKESLIKYHHGMYEHLSDLCTASYLIAKKHHLKKNKP